MKKDCIVCKRKTNNKKYCSFSCAAKGRWLFNRPKMIEATIKSQKIAARSRIGMKHKSSSIKRISISRKGKALNERNGNWAGDKVGYNALHTWISRKYGKPKTCEKCLRSNLVGKKIHWANKSGKYLRKRSDWLRLCAKCHLNYDGYKVWIGHIKNEERKCILCGKKVLSRDLCSKHYNRFNVVKRSLRSLKNV